MKSKIFLKLSRFFKRNNACSLVQKELDSANNTPDSEEYERCILCGKLTCIPISMPVDWRENYEIGMGQLCAECARKQQKATESEHVLTAAQILYAVQESRCQDNGKENL